MRPKDYIKFEINVNNVWTDYTDGILDIQIVRGIQGYEGNYQLPESGICTITTRNPDMDPHINTDIRMNKLIRIKAYEDILFTGRLMRLDVDYQPKGNPQITTLTAVDIIGDMALTTLPDGFTERLGSSMDISAMFQELEISGIIPTFNNPIRETTAFSFEYGNASGNTRSGSTALQVATILANSDMQFFYSDRFNDCYLYSKIDKKKNETHKIQFDSRGIGTSYQDIELTDGFDQLINELSISSTRTNTTAPLLNSPVSIAEWGPKKLNLSVSTSFLGTEANAYKNRIFADSVYPTKEIFSIQWDGNINPSLAATIDILDNVYIYHEVDPEDISRQYGVLGINHTITEGEWQVKYFLKNFFWPETTFVAPIIAVDNPNPTIQDDITWTISNLDDLILNGATYSWQYDTGTVPSSLIGTSAGNTQSITKNYTLSEVGVKNVKLVFNNGYNFPRTSNISSVNVVGAAPTNAAFTYTINPQDSSVYTFTATANEAQSYTFYFGDGSSRTTTTGTYTWRYSTGGSKTAYVIATNAYGTNQSASQTFTVTMPSGPGFSGNYPVRYVRLSCPAYNAPASGLSWPYFGNFRALNYLNINRASTSAVVWAGQYELYPSEPDGVINGWYKLDLKQNTFPSLTSDFLSTAYTGIRSTNSNDYISPMNSITGHCEWSLIIDLQSEWFDINSLALGVQQRPSTSQSSAAPNMNVYVTYETDTMTNPDLWHWDLLGTINKTTGAFTAAAGVPMPPTRDQVNNFTFTKTNNFLSFTTSSWNTATYYWNFGDGESSTVQNPNHTFINQGTYTVTLTKTGTDGTIVSSSQSITITAQDAGQGTRPVRYITLRQVNASTTTPWSLQNLNVNNPCDTVNRRSVWVNKYSPSLARFKAMTVNNVNRLADKTTVDYDLEVISTKYYNFMTPDGVDIVNAVGSSPVSSCNRRLTDTGTSNIGARPVYIWEPELNPSNPQITNWWIAYDLGQDYYDIRDIFLSFNKNGSETLNNPLPTYEVFVGIGTGGLKLGTITPPALDTNINTWQEVQMVPLVPMPPNL